jgi:basic membrane protein A and related proteins
MGHMRLHKLLAVVVALSALVTACGSTNAPRSHNGAPRVALVLGGLATDGGFSQTGADAVTRLQQEGVITAQVRESVTDPAHAEPILRQYAAEGYDLVIGWGLGFSDSVFRVGTEFPNVHFVATGGVDILQKTTANVETWTYAAEQLGYLLGFIAGQTKLSPVGVVDGEQQPFLQAQWFGFSQGLRAANPAAAQLPTIYTGSFEDAQKATQATTAQVNAGAKLVATNAEGYSPGVAAVAKSASIATVGMAATTSDAARAVNVGRVKVDMVPILRDWITRIKDRTFGNKGTTSTITNRSLIPADINPVAAAPALPHDLDRRVSDLAEQLAAGKVTVESWTPGK